MSGLLDIALQANVYTHLKVRINTELASKHRGARPET